MPRTFAPPPGWSANGHRIKAEMDYGRGPEKTWVYGALRVRDGKELQRFLQFVDRAIADRFLPIVAARLTEDASCRARGLEAR